VKNILTECKAECKFEYSLDLYGVNDLRIKRFCLSCSRLDSTENIPKDVFKNSLGEEKLIQLFRKYN